MHAAALALVLVAAAPAPLKFGWSAPTRVEVTEKVVKKDRSSTMKYDVVLTKRKGGYEVRLEKLRFVALDGVVVDRANVPADVQQAEAMAAVVPVLLLRPDGTVEGVGPLDDMLARVVAGMRPEVAASVRAAFASPAVQDGMKQRASDFWNAWVGAWVGMDVAAGQEQTATTSTPTPGGPVPTAVVLRNRGPDASHPGALRLEVETKLEGETFRAAMVAMMKQMMAAAGPNVKHGLDVDAMLKAARRTTTSEVVVDPKTLRPYKARMVSDTSMTFGEAINQEHEEHDYEFAWPAARAKR